MTDLMIIGAGPGGYKAALYAAENGLKVTIFEEGHVGGTCLNVGCIPTKTYVHSATFEEAIERQPQVVEQLRGGVEALLSHPNITLVRERASFVDSSTVETPGGQRYSVEDTEGHRGAIIIATGSSTKYLPVPGSDHPCVVDSAGLLALQERPQRLCIIGAGVIGMEFASVFNRFGSEVTVVEFLKECLPALDGDIAKRLRKQMERKGVKFHLQCGVSRIGDGQVFFSDKKGKEAFAEADVVLMATGRRPNVSPDFSRAGFSFDDRRGILVDEHFETTVPGVYAIGDVNGRQMLAHAAEYQGRHVVNRLLGREDGIRFDVMPAAIFTSPEAACVGPSEEELKGCGTNFTLHKAFFRANGKALAMGETEGMVKLCCEPGEGRLLSCHAFGPHAADLVQEATAFISLGATLRQLRETVHIHPTLSEVLIEAQ